MLPILQPYNLGWWANQSASQRPIKSFYSDRFEFFQESVRTYVPTDMAAGAGSLFINRAGIRF